MKTAVHACLIGGDATPGDEIDRPHLRPSGLRACHLADLQPWRGL
jgi:hypothetical protein